MAELNFETLRQKMEDVLKEDPTMILAFRTKLVTDEMWEYAIAMEPSLFTECKRKTFRISLVAMSADGLHIGNVDPITFTGEQFTRLCEVAVEQNPKAIALIPKEFRTERLVSYAYSRDPELLMSEKKLTSGMVLSIIDHNPRLIQYVVDPTDEMIIHALSKDPRVIVYFTHISDEVRNYFEETYPQYASMFLHD